MSVSIAKPDAARARLRGVDLIPIDDAILEVAALLEPPLLRSLDAIHLATARALGSDLGVLITYDRRLAEILAHATEVFCKKGYEGASMRDLSRDSGMSLAGLSYYFESKERLLYLIQKHTFTTIVQLTPIHISEPTRLLSISYALFCLKKKIWCTLIPLASNARLL